MVGDSRIDVETARRAGSASCLVRYGFGSRAGDADLAGADYSIDEPLELLSLIRHLRALIQGTGALRGLVL
jgi:phosphoglycolate phosphatase-like HAD superfamily hydrolase